MEKERKRKRGEGEKWDRQQWYKHLTPSSVLLLHPSRPPRLYCHWGGAKEVTHSYKHSINLPATLLVLDTVPASSVCLPVMLPSLCSWCQVTPPRAQRCRSNQMPFFLPAPCQNFTGRQLCFTSAYGIKRRLWQGPWHNMAQVNLYVGDLFPLKMQWWRAAGKSHSLWRGGLG